jgi:hypothetical protein
VCTGKPGTVILCDTTGFHKGGHPTRGLRLLFHWVYTTDAGVMFNGKRYKITGTPDPTLTPAQRFAIGHL